LRLTLDQIGNRPVPENIAESSFDRGQHNARRTADDANTGAMMRAQPVGVGRTWIPGNDDLPTDRQIEVCEKLARFRRTKSHRWKIVLKSRALIRHAMARNPHFPTPNGNKSQPSSPGFPRFFSNSLSCSLEREYAQRGTPH
jgi:hypothetical protein